MASNSDKRRMERTHRKCFRCASEDHLIKKCQKPPKDNEKRQKQVSFSEKGNRVCDNDKNNSYKKIHASMARMSGNEKCLNGEFGDSSQLTNWIFDSGATCHMTPQVSDFIQVFLEDTDKHIEIADGDQIT